MHVCERWELPEPEYAAGEPYDKEVGRGVKRCGYNFCIWKIEVVPLMYTPPRKCNCFKNACRFWWIGCRFIRGIIRVFGGLGLPREYSTVAADGVNLLELHSCPETQDDRPTYLPLAEKYAPTTASRCPAKFFGRKSSRGSKVNSLAVISRDVVKKHLGTSISPDGPTGQCMHELTLNLMTTVYSEPRHDDLCMCDAAQMAQTLERDGSECARPGRVSRA